MYSYTPYLVSAGEKRRVSRWIDIPVRKADGIIGMK
jgi:hypothetical protein